MKQHERTHGGSASGASEDAVSSVSKNKDDLRKRRKEDVRRESVDAVSPVMAGGGQGLGGGYDTAGFDTSVYPALPLETGTSRKGSLQSRPSISVQGSGIGGGGVRTYSDLDTLAMAASGVRYDGFMQWGG